MTDDGPSTESRGDSTERFVAERKVNRNRGADLVNRLRVIGDGIFPTPFGRLYRQVQPYTMLSYARLRGVYRGVRRILDQGIEGDLVECGTARGGSAALMQLTCQTHGSRRQLWVFDTFEGLPPPTEDDPDFQLAKNWEGKCRGSLDEVEGLFRSVNALEDTTFVKGLFQDTLPVRAADIGQIAFLHLDGDWYESTKVCLEHLYDKVASGGVIQIDDYGHWAGARKAFHEFMEPKGIPLPLIYLDYTGRQFIKP